MLVVIVYKYSADLNIDKFARHASVAAVCYISKQEYL